MHFTLWNSHKPLKTRLGWGLKMICFSIKLVREDSWRLILTESFTKYRIISECLWGTLTNWVGRLTITAGGTITWCRVPDWIKRRMQVDSAFMSKCFLTVDAMCPTVFPHDSPSMMVNCTSELYSFHPPAAFVINVLHHQGKEIRQVVHNALLAYYLKDESWLSERKDWTKLCNIVKHHLTI